ncbi:hypothetical protein EV401DRAFT_955591 [Pisolithus croceorrhizus]|nr:hypothetical protein EV401DRAFT_955591 [Pisolithus croceorrhizus]
MDDCRGTKSRRRHDSLVSAGSSNGGTFQISTTITAILFPPLLAPATGLFTPSRSWLISPSDRATLRKLGYNLFSFFFPFFLTSRDLIRKWRKFAFFGEIRQTQWKFR